MSTPVKTSIKILSYFTTEVGPLCHFHNFVFQLDRTPLHWACAKGHLQIVELLVDMGADLEAKDKVL